MPDIDKINNVAVADISKIDSITFADGQKVNNQDVSLVADAHTLIDEDVTFSNQTTISYASLLESTYNAHMFEFINLHSDNDDVYFRFSTNDSSNHQLATFWEMWHNEDDTDADQDYNVDFDTLISESDQYATLARGLGADVADEAASGFLWIYGLNDTSHAKLWFSVMSSKGQDDTHYGFETAGWIYNSGLDAITQIDFSMSGGTFDGTIKVFGLAKA
tara:strand:+ start:178 stop:834 length:657 start_codon:yes stop_codon:yes gene_type:complete